MTDTPTVRFERDIPVRHNVDILVAGGGPAGVAAALAAARQGRRVFLAEGHTCFGGMGTAGMVPLFMQFGDGENFLAAGIGSEIYDALYERGGTVSPPGSLAPAIRAEILKRIYDDIIVDAGVEFAFQTNVIGVETDGGHVARALCWAKSGLFAVDADVFIDCTGDGDLATWAGAPFEKGDETGGLMPGTLCSLWSDVDWDAVHEARGQGQNAEAALLGAFDDGAFTIPDRHLPGMWQVGAHVGGGNIGHTFGVDGTDERSLTEALLWGRELLGEYERFYKGYLKGYESMELVATGSLLGLRETRRIMGDYVLCLDDFNSRAIFADEIGRYCYPVDIHSPSPSEEAQEQARDEFVNMRYKKGESYGIPYRSLVPRDLDNVLVAGRCISADRYMQGSCRVMPGCYITGQAAGVAAALAIEGEGTTRGVDVAELRGRLKAMGAYLPDTT